MKLWLNAFQLDEIMKRKKKIDMDFQKQLGERKSLRIKFSVD